MHSDAEAIQKNVRTYIKIGALLLVCTGLTVAAAELHLAVPVGIAVALAIAATKGSMVASVFMHLSHERRWIYGALLITVVFFVVLLFLPVITVSDGLARGTTWVR